MKYPMNPLLHPDTFVPDVEAHVWEDGRIYLYGSLDKEGNMNYCSDAYHVYSSDNMVDWVDHGVSFRLSQAGWARGNNALYAPDCAFRNGVYYLYYCVPDGRCGVAVSTSPCGPFEDKGPMAHVTMIDPAVLVDDDGQAYLYWGQFDGVRAAKLRDNMLEIDPATITQPLSVAEHEFHEGSSVRKINGKYYYLFTDTHRHGRKATSMGYAVSDHPLTGFVYQGVIVDNFGCDPETWNNHGSMECFHGQWYVFYHRSTHASRFSRRVCAEPVTIREDGTIGEVKMTTSGVAGTVPAGERMPACRACEMSGHGRIEGDRRAASGFALGQLRPGDTAVYRYLDFHGEDTFTATLRANGNVRVEIYTNGWYRASLTAGPGEGYAASTVRLPAQTGRQEVQLRFYGDFSEAALSDFVFQKSEATLAD